MKTEKYYSMIRAAKTYADILNIYDAITAALYDDIITVEQYHCLYNAMHNARILRVTD